MFKYESIDFDTKASTEIIFELSNCTYMLLMPLVVGTPESCVIW